MAKESRFRIGSRALYELPLPFWKGLLGEGLHFHLGHFSDPNTSLSQSMRNAVIRLADRIPGSAGEVLDIGCGWGGPAFELTRLWRHRVLGLTISRRQTRWVNFYAKRHGLPVRAMQVNVEDVDLSTYGSFDVIWIYEAIEHIENRRNLLRNLRACARLGARLAAAVHCRAPNFPRVWSYSDVMGTAPLDSPDELEAALQQTGWNVISVSDCTDLTLPVWDFWIDNLQKVRHLAPADFVSRFHTEFVHLKRLYRNGSFRSVQIVAQTTM